MLRRAQSTDSPEENSKDSSNGNSAEQSWMNVIDIVIVVQSFSQSQPFTIHLYTR